MKTANACFLCIVAAAQVSCFDPAGGEQEPADSGSAFDTASALDRADILQDAESGPADAECTAELAVGVGFTCVRSEDGRVWCWGTNESGQLTGDELASAVPTPRLVTGLRAPALKLAAGMRHACAALSDGSVWCWGANHGGQLGTGTISETEPNPVQVQNLTGEILSLSASGGHYLLGDSEQPVDPVDHTCAVREDRTVWCWGSDNTGQAGGAVVSPGAQVLVPRMVQTAGAGFAQVSAGLYHTCARRDDGRVECWGYLGGHPPAADVKPRVIEGAEGVIQVAAGDEFTCVLNGSGEVRCWGGNRSGECGQGSPGKPALVEAPMVVPLGQSATAIATGAGLACAVLQDASVWCWGGNVAGGLGNGQVWTSPNGGTATPTESLLAEPARSLGAHTHVCATTTHDEIWCWGNRAGGALGDGIGGEPLTPTPVPTPVKVLDYCQ